MGLDVTGIGTALDAVNGILGKFFPDKNQAERDAAAQALAVMQVNAAAAAAQTEIDKAEAQSNDPLQHWRGGAGWVCVAALAWTFVIEPMVAAGLAIAHVQATLPALDMAQLMDLMLGMLGLGGLHTYQQIKGAK